LQGNSTRREKDEYEKSTYRVLGRLSNKGISRREKRTRGMKARRGRDFEETSEKTRREISSRAGLFPSSERKRKGGQAEIVVRVGSRLYNSGVGWGEGGEKCGIMNGRTSAYFIVPTAESNLRKDKRKRKGLSNESNYKGEGTALGKNGEAEPRSLRVKNSCASSFVSIKHRVFKEKD